MSSSLVPYCLNLSELDVKTLNPVMTRAAERLTAMNSKLMVSRILFVYTHHRFVFYLKQRSGLKKLIYI